MALNWPLFQKDIGFNVAVLLTNLSEHMPHDTRLQTFLELAESVLNYFQPYLGRIEIMGSAKRIERVYFEISESSRTQWEKPQVKLIQHVNYLTKHFVYLKRHHFSANAVHSQTATPPSCFPLYLGQGIQASVHLWCCKWRRGEGEDGALC